MLLCIIPYKVKRIDMLFAQHKEHGRPYEEGSTKGQKTPNTLAGRLISACYY